MNGTSAIAVGDGGKIYHTENSGTNWSEIDSGVVPDLNAIEFNDYAVKISDKIKNAGISSSVDLKNNNLNYKIRDHSLAKIPLLLICGKKEVDSNSVTIRRLDSNKQENMGIDQFLKTFSALNKASSN